MTLFTFLETARTILAPYREYFVAVLILISSYFVARLLYYFFERKIKKDARRKVNTFEDELLKQSELPIFFGIFLCSLFIVARYVLTIFQSHLFGLSKFFIVAAIIWSVYSGLKFINLSLKWYAWKHKRWNNSLFIVRKLIVVIVCLIAFLLILNELGFEITPLLASLGIGGLAVALALQPTLANYFAGLYIASDETVRPGDYVEIDKQIKGKVESISWRSTKIRTFQGNTIIVPNSKLADTIVTNYNEPREELSIYVPFGVRYDSDLEKVEKVAFVVGKTVMRKDPAGIATEDPIIRFREFGDSSINVVAILRAHNYSEGFALRHHFMKELAARFRKERINFAFPSQSVYVETPLLMDMRSGKKRRK